MPSLLSPITPGMSPAAHTAHTSDVSAVLPHATINGPATVTDVYVGPSSQLVEQPQEPRKVEYDRGYKLKQYGTDVLVVGGAALAFALLVSPEPLVTKIIGGLIALACILGGTIGKHHFFQEAYLSQALEKAVGRLGQQIDQLDSDIETLKCTRDGLTQTNRGLEQTRTDVEHQVGNLKLQVDRLKTEVNQAFDELNKDRASFETEKRAKLSQLNNEIAEADARGDRAQRKLDAIAKREAELNSFEQELDTRRKNLVTAEAKLEKMQSALLNRVTGL